MQRMNEIYNHTQSNTLGITVDYISGTTTISNTLLLSPGQFGQLQT